MKLKKALSGVLAAAMVVTLAPTMAFASTTNTVASVPTVKSDAKIPAATVLTLTVKDTAGWDTTGQKIKLTLSNAKWAKNPDGNSKDGSKNDTNNITAGTDNVLTVSATKKDNVTAVSTSVKYITATDNTLEMVITPADKLDKDGYITLNIAANAIETESTDGPATIAIDGLDSKISSSTITIATVGSSTTTATVSGDVKTYPRGECELGTSIEIRETAINSIVNGSTQHIELKLPKGVNWDSKTTIGGDMFSTASVSVSADDSRILKIDGAVSGSNEVRNVLTVKPVINIGKDASKGDITVQVTAKADGNEDAVADANDLVIANYADESVEVSTLETVPEIISGYTKNSKDKTFYVYATVKESMKGALTAGKYIDFTLPEEVQICGAIQTSDKAGNKGSFGSNLSGKIKVGEDSDNNGAIGLDKKDASTFEFTIPSKDENGWKTTKGNTVTFKIPVTVQADFTGDIKMTVSGAKAGLDEKELVVATAKSPITVEAKATDVKNGVQNQTVSNITIKEVETGYLDDNTNLTVAFDDLGLTNALVFDDADVKVTAGDIELGKTTVDKGVINIKIKSASAKASTIEISGISATLNRTLPEGKYDLLVGGDALIKNNKYNGEDFDVTPVKVEGYVNIVTPADTNTVKVNASFVIGKTSYTNNGTEVTMDAAPYIAKNRTMVPIRYIANACGVTDENITWDQATRTATISGPNNVVTIKMGSNTITTSNGVITMDTVAVNTGNRIYVPARFIANALGATVTWDAATQTVGITK